MRRAVYLSGRYQRDYAKRLIDEAREGDVMSISAPTRSLEQNAKLWPMLEDLREQVPAMSTY
jgi:hypothetical protein